MSVEDPESSPGGDRAVIGSRSVDLAISVLILGLAVLFGWDSWRSGVSWAPDGPQVGYFPFYLSIIMGLASLYGMISTLAANASEDTPFVTRDQLGRVLKVLVPIFVFCGLTGFLGIYVASFLLVTGFMRVIGRISLWISLLTAIVFTLVMFATFEIAFNVIMPKGPLEAALGF